jgi:hypothetical protein
MVLFQPSHLFIQKSSSGLHQATPLLTGIRFLKLGISEDKTRMDPLSAE